MQDETTQELISKCQNGDKQAFAQLVKNYQQLVFNFLYRLIPDWMDLEDLAQDVWIKVYQSIGKMKNSATFSTWLHRIAVNTYYDRMRKHGKKQEISIDSSRTKDDEGASIDLPDNRLIPEELLLSEEWKSYVDMKVRSLPEQHKMMIIMRDTQNLSYDEIAEILGITLGTVKSRIARARERLIKELADYFKEVKADVSK